MDSSLFDTIGIYAAFREVAIKILGKEDLEWLEQFSRSNIKPNEDEMTFITVFAALAKSTHHFAQTENDRIFRFYARNAIKKAASKIEMNRQLELIHILLSHAQYGDIQYVAQFLIIFLNEESPEPVPSLTSA